MKKYTLTLILFFSFLIGQSQDLFHNINSFLIDNVNNGMVDYKKLKTNSKKLDAIIAEIQTYDLTGKEDNFKKAFYINAYNLLVIHQVLAHYPVDSPLKVDGFFKKNKLKVANESLTLDEIEFQKLMNPYRDPRIHFALGCAAKSCPALYDNVYDPEHLEEQLKFRAQLIIDTDRYVSVNNKTQTITLNKIFDWYKDHFSFSSGSVINFINKYRYYKVSENMKIAFEEYNWQLNEL